MKNMMHELSTILQILISFQCFFFSGFLLFSRRNRHVSNRILSVLLLVLAVHMAMNLLLYQFCYACWQAITIGLGFAYGPLLYMYTCSLVFRDFRAKQAHLAHIIPSLSALILMMNADLPISFFALSILFSLGGYCFVTWRYLKKYREILKHTRSQYDVVALQWLSKLLLITLVLFGINTFNILSNLTHVGFSITFGEAIQFTGLLLLVNYIIYYGLQYPNLFEGITEEDTKLAHQATKDIGRPSDAQVLEVLHIVDKYMEKEKPYLNPDLVIKTLGRKLSLNARQVSQAINLGKQQNFSEYVNGFRIEFAKKLLEEDKENSISILDIMLRAGFNTKSNFNRSFKKTTGMTPKEFRSAHRS